MNDSQQKMNSYKRTYYDTLNIEPTASNSQIAEAYFRLKKVYQEDNQALYSVLDLDHLKRKAREIEEAYRTLNDPLRRSLYDKNVLQIEWSVSHAPERLDPLSILEKKTRHIRELIPRRFQAEKSADHKLISQAEKLVDTSADLGDGQLLQQLRELFGVSKTEIQDYTKVSVEHINNIENNNFEKLPQVVYVKGFLRSYVGYLGIKNSEKIIESFIKRLECWDQEKTG